MTLEARIRGQIEARIRSGEWKPGTRIPFEHELVAEHGCARATVNKALSRLAREGLIERRRRAGSFVARPQFRSAVIGVPDIGLLVAARGEPYRWQLADRGVDQEAPDPVIERARGRWLRLAGLHHASARPFGWEARWIDLATVPEAEAVDFAAEAPAPGCLVMSPGATRATASARWRRHPRSRVGSALFRAHPASRSSDGPGAAGNPLPLSASFFPATATIWSRISHPSADTKTPEPLPARALSF